MGNCGCKTGSLTGQACPIGTGCKTRAKVVLGRSGMPLVYGRRRVVVKPAGATPTEGTPEYDAYLHDVQGAFQQDKERQIAQQGNQQQGSGQGGLSGLFDFLGGFGGGNNNNQNNNNQQQGGNQQQNQDLMNLRNFQGPAPVQPVAPAKTDYTIPVAIGLAGAAVAYGVSQAGKR